MNPHPEALVGTLCLLGALVAGATFAGRAQASEPTEASTRAASLDVEVRQRSPDPRGPSIAIDHPPITVNSTDIEPHLDGRFSEDAWRTAPVARPVAGLRNQPPPHPTWTVRVLATPGGLAFALAGLPEDIQSTVSVDPDGARLGWVTLTVRDGSATLHRCAADPVHSVHPFPVAWRVDKRPCDPPSPALATHGPDGWEVMIPWSALGATTDDLTVQWWAIGDGATASFDRGRSARDYPAAGRPIVVPGQEDRAEGIAIAWDRSEPSAEVRVSVRGLREPERWLYDVHYNGRMLYQGSWVLEPDARNRAAVVERFPIQAHTSTGISIRQARDEPLARGARIMPWSLKERATLATPIHRGELEIRVNQSTRDRQVELAVRDRHGTVLATQPLTLPRGESTVLIQVPPDWPDAIEVSVGPLLPETWQPAIRHGAAARALGGRP